MDNVLIDERRIHVDFSQSVAKVKYKGKDCSAVSCPVFAAFDSILIKYNDNDDCSLANKSCHHWLGQDLQMSLLFMSKAHWLQNCRTYILYAVVLATGRASGLWKVGCWFVGGNDLTGALHVLQFHLSPPPPSSLAPTKSRTETFWYQLTQVHLENRW